MCADKMLGRICMRHMPCFLIRVFSLIALFSCVSGGQTPAFAGDAIRINGSGTGLELMKPLIEIYAGAHPGVTFDMQKPLGSSGAIKALIAGALDIAVTSRPLKPDEAARGAKVSTFGKTPLAIVTKKGVPRKNILIGELEAIYSGTTRKWPDGENIRVVLRPLEDIDTKILRGLSPGMDKAVSGAQKRQGMITAVTDTESNEMVARTEGSIGTAGLAGIMAGNISLNILSLNGVMPDPMTLADGSYPLAKDIDFVTTANPPDAAAKFLQFIYSDKGREVVERLGVLLPAAGKARK
ncbi:MAG: ABC transporter substrate-binding protein [Thermodesulfovibrio sp.]|nr:ABC transporter substrate-binding protein [Thermodesulfovibrio sp.]